MQGIITGEGVSKDHEQSNQISKQEVVSEATTTYCIPAMATPTKHTPIIATVHTPAVGRGDGISPVEPEESAVMEMTRKALLKKLVWASTELELCSSVEASTELCNLIQSISTTLKGLKP